MPSPTRCLTAGDAFTIVRDRAVHPPAHAPHIGLELEWLSRHLADPCRRVRPDDLAPVLAAVGDRLPCGGRVTIEPGGQIELSTLPHDSVANLVDATLADARVLRTACADAGIVLESAGLDTMRHAQRVLDRDRYRAMETYFDAHGPDGRTMMCNSAALQLNVDVSGDPVDAWCAAEAAAVILAGVFNAPSPNRMDVWSRIDRTRTAPVRARGADPAAAWAQYALDARVMFVRVDATDCVPMLDGMAFGEWCERGHPLGWPTEADLVEHLTTLFPPVRPRGWLEIRTLDSLDDDTWPRAVELAAALLLDGPARERLLRRGEVPAWT